MLTRDSVVLTLSIIGGVLGVLVAQIDLLPPSWKGPVTILSALVSTVAGILRSSPLAGAETPQKASRTAIAGLLKLSAKE